MLEWMYWSWQSAIAVAIYFSAIIVLTIGRKYGWYSDLPRKGYLKFETKFTERVFLSLIVIVFVGLFWLYFLPEAPSVGAGIIGFILAAILLKWG